MAVVDFHHQRTERFANQGFPDYCEQTKSIFMVNSHVVFIFFLFGKLISSLIAAIFQGQEYTIKNLTNFQGALFIFLTNMTFQNVFGVVNVSNQTF